MSYNFRAYNPNQILLLSPSLDDWLPKKHPARFIHHVVDNLDLTPLKCRHREDGHGRAAYNPAMMLKILFYAYCMGIPSSRKIAQKLVDDVAFRWLAAGNMPDFRTIAAFRHKHLGAVKEMFVQVLLLCKQAGLAKVGVVALDGTKVKANAALDRNRSWEKLEVKEKALREEIDNLLAKAEAVDREEDESFGDDSGDGMPKISSKKEMLALILRAKKELEQQAMEKAKEQQEKIEARAKEEAESGKKRGRKPKPADATVKQEAKANLTDPDSRIQKTRQGHVQGYNGQVVCSEDQIIVAYDVVQDQNDYGQLIPMVEAAQANLYEIGEEADVVLADAGYCSDDNLEEMSASGMPEAFIATKKDHKLRAKATSPPRGRIPKDLTLRERIERKLQTKRGRAMYKKRGQIVEPIFGQMKKGRGLLEFLLRSLEKVKAEFGLWCLTHNILKLHRAWVAWA